MSPRTITWPLRLLAILLTFVLALAVLAIAAAQGWLSVLGINSESKDSQVIRAIERTQEISLVSLGIQGLREEKRSREVFGKDVPGTGEQVLMQYEFTAKLGVDGQHVEVVKSGENAIRISVPEFIFIGHDDPSFRTAAEGGGVLRWITPDIDQIEMVNEILNDDARDKYIADHEDVLEAQTRLFYDSLIASIDPTIETTYEFSS